MPDPAPAAGVTRPAFVDAHVHLWDRGRLRYPWLDDHANAAIASDYRLADHVAAARDWNVVGCVHVEAGAHPDDALRETEWLDGIAVREGMPDAIVARVALDDPDIDRLLDRQTTHGRVRGVRHLVNWHPSDPARRAYRHDLTLDPAWRRGYARLARHDLSFDFHGFPPQLAGLVHSAKANPNVPLILNHLALPIPGDGLGEWRAGITALAALPHVAIKLSGAGFIASPFDPLAFRDIVLEVIDRFGTDRVMVASNFPTDRLFADLDTTLGAYEAILAGFSIDERRDLWGRNANHVYRLGLDL